MLNDLLNRPVEKRPDTVTFPGRVLFLLDDADLVRAQLEGQDLTLTPELKDRLRDQISTDEITPGVHLLLLRRDPWRLPLPGFHGPESGHGRVRVPGGSVRAGGFVCSVAGKRRGKGSSREQSPYAELMAGIRIVVGESIERIYNENCQNLGIFTTTDFGVIDRIRAGESIPLAEFTAGKDEITRQIIEYGGLFEFNMARLQGKVTLPTAHALEDGATADRPMTLAEKIFARKWVVDAASDRLGVPWVAPGEAGFFRTDVRFSHEYVTPMGAIFFEEKLGPDAKVNDADSILFSATTSPSSTRP